MTAFFNKTNTTSKKRTATKAAVSKKEVSKDKKKPIATGVSVSTVSLGGTSQKMGGLDLAMVLTRPHVTEKATDLSGMVSTRSRSTGLRTRCTYNRLLKNSTR